MGGVLARRRRLLVALLPLLLCAEAASNSGEVRCFCNVPPCVTTGYMCKSALGACFSEARQGSAPAGPGARLHGCLDMLHRDQQEACGEDAGLACCSTDMCNHVDGLAHAHAHGRHYAAWQHGRLNATALTGAAANASASARGAATPPESTATAYASGEVWLKAATIAVPVCGVVILVALVAAAVRILRRDARDLAAASAACKAPPLARCKVPLLPSAAHHHRHHHHHHNHHHHAEAAERRPDKNEANARRNRAAAHANLFRGDEASGTGPAGEPPAKLYHKAAITWRADGCACPV